MKNYYKEWCNSKLYFDDYVQIGLGLTLEEADVIFKEYLISPISFPYEKETKLFNKCYRNYLKAKKFKKTFNQLLEE